MVLNFNPILLIIPILAILMYGLGAELRYTHFTAFLRQPKALIFGLIAQLLFLPLVAFFLIFLFNIPNPYAMGILLLALSPGGSSSNAFTHLAGGNVALSVSLTAISGVVTVFTIPLILMLYMNSQELINLPIGNMLLQNIVIMLLPLILGMLTLHFKPKWAMRAATFVKSKGMFMLLFLALIFFFDNRKLIITHFTSIALVLFLLIVITTSLGLIIGNLLKLPSPDKKAIFVEIGMQNAAQAIALACSPIVFNNSEMAIPAIIYALIMNLFLLSYLAIVRYRAKSIA